MNAAEYVDLIVQLGGKAEGTIRAAASRSALPEYPLDVSGGSKHVADLAHALAFYGELITESIARTAEFEDPGTTDLLINHSVYSVLSLVRIFNHGLHRMHGWEVRDCLIEKLYEGLVA